VDTEETRFLNFERWWSGYYLMASEEIHFIVDSLFIGNHLEKGNLELENDKWINLKNIEDPVVVFASSGDNITPPQQALNWIVKVYGSVEEIRRQQQVIVYLLHEEIGHLGIFVSGKVARKEHKAIIDSIDLIEYLPPGLYEMVIEEQDTQLGITDYRIRFQERRIQDILALDDGLQDEDAFQTVAAVSQAGDLAYRTFLRPWIQFWSTELSAEILRQLHPLRVSRYIFSDRNPSVWPVKALTPMIKNQRRPVTADNPFLTMEKIFSDSTKIGLNFYRDMRDICQEYWFKSVYDNPWMKTFFGDGAAEKNDRQEALEKSPKREVRDPDRCLRTMEKGGFVAGLVRIILALAVADKSLDRDELAAAEDIVLNYQPSKKIKRADYIKMVKEQSRILQTDIDQAIGTLPKLIKTSKDRQRAMAAARQVVFADKDLNPKEEAIWTRISKSLKVKY
jgi:tellurite resistance protein